MTSPRPDIAVILPVYNAAAFVAGATASALDQPEVAQVVLVDDGSTDGSADLCAELAAAHPERVRLAKHPGGANRGAAESRNLGAASCDAPLIAFLDADDYYLLGRFATSRPMLDDPRVDGVHEAVATEFATPEARHWWLVEQGRDETTRFREAIAPEDLLDAWLSGDRGGFHTAGVLVRRELFERVGGFEPGLRMAQDTHLWVRLAAAGRLVAGSLDRPVAVRRLHGANRIMTDVALHRRYHLEMSQSLVRWSRGRLSAERRGRLLDALAFNWLEQERPDGSLRSKLRCLSFAAATMARDPAAGRRSARLRRLLLGRLAG